MVPIPGTVGEILRTPALGIIGVPGFAGPFGFDTKLGDFISSLLGIMILLAIILSFFWLVWGAFQYIFAGGNKDSLAKARSRIIWAVIGLIITLLAFLIAQFAIQILGPQKGTPIG